MKTELEKRRVSQRVREGSTVTQRPVGTSNAALAEGLQLLMGQRGNPQDRAVSQRELASTVANLVKTTVVTEETAPSTAIGEIVEASLTENGYIVFLISGVQFIFQWGMFTSVTDDWQTVPFNKNFTSACWAVVPSLALGYGVLKTLTNFQVNRLNDVDGAPDVFWVAVGV